MPLTRRALIAGAGASAALAPAAPAGMRTVPATGEAIPAIGLGTWITFNVGSDPRLLTRSVAVMRAFFEEGGGMIDCSPMYGSSAATVGHGLAALGRPAGLFSAEKVWTSSPDRGPAQMAASRADWGVARFDLMQVHNLLAAEAHLATLFAMKAEGRIGHIGITTSHGRRHDETEALMRRHPLDFVQLTYNPLDRAVEDRLLPLARARGIGVIVNRPFRRGGLIARMRGVPLPGYAADLGVDSWAGLMLKFILSHPDVTVAIPATTRPAHLRANKAAARGPLPGPKLRARIAAAVAAA